MKNRNNHVDKNKKDRKKRTYISISFCLIYIFSLAASRLLNASPLPPVVVVDCEDRECCCGAVGSDMVMLVLWGLEFGAKGSLNGSMRDFVSWVI